MRIFIGNLGSEITSRELQELFSPYGEVVDGGVVKDVNDISRGFGYVIMRSASEGATAISNLNKKLFKEQFLVVSEAINSARYDKIAV